MRLLVESGGVKLANDLFLPLRQKTPLAILVCCVCSDNKSIEQSMTRHAKRRCGTKVRTRQRGAKREFME